MASIGNPVHIAVIGAGLIGERHARLINTQDDCHLVAIVDPHPNARELANHLSVECYEDFDTALQSELSPDGVVIATPNSSHKTLALACIAQGIPCLVEKPLADTSKDAAEIVTAFESADVPVLVGHHRRYHRASEITAECLRNNGLGKMVAAQVTWCLRKPDDYFEKGVWRTTKGGGPIWINLIHEIDLLRHFLGEIEEVSAMTANVTRGFSVEDTAAITLRFLSGAVATIIISDTAPSPWHFEGASGENPNIAETGQDGMRLFGTMGSLGFPSLQHWWHGNLDKGNWADAIGSAILEELPPMNAEVALRKQIGHFVDVIANNAKPLVTARDGLLNIQVTEAILQSAKEGKSVAVSNLPSNLTALAG